MRIIYRQPIEIMNDVLFQQFQNNLYFKFVEFAEKVKAVQSKEPIEGDMIKDFIYQMIDENRVAQEYVGDGVTPMTPEEQKVLAGNKSIRFKLIAQQA